MTLTAVSLYFICSGIERRRGELGNQRREDVGCNGEKKEKGRKRRGKDKRGAVKRIGRINVENERKLEKEDCGK